MPQPESSVTLTLITIEPSRRSRAQDQTSKIPVRRPSESRYKHVLRERLSNAILAHSKTKQKIQLDLRKSGATNKELREEAIGLGPGEEE